MGLFERLGKLKEEKKNEALKRLSQYDSLVLSELLASINGKLQVMLETNATRLKTDGFSEDERKLLEALFDVIISRDEQELEGVLVQKGIDHSITSGLYSKLQSVSELLRRNVWTTGLIEIYD